MLYFNTPKKNNIYNLISWLSLSILTIALTSCFAEAKAHKPATGKRKRKIAFYATPSGSGRSAVQESYNRPITKKEDFHSPVKVTHREPLTATKVNPQPVIALPTKPLKEKPVVVICFNGIPCYICHHTFTKEEDAEVLRTPLEDYELLVHKKDCLEALYELLVHKYELLVHKKDCLEALIKREQELKIATPTPISGVLQLLTDHKIETTCPLCMEDFTEADQVLCKLGDPCTCKTHVYHNNCISDVLTTNPNPSCPCCRQPIKETKITNMLNGQEIKLTIQPKPNHVLLDIETKIKGLRYRFGDQCAEIEYLTHLSGSPAFSLAEKERMFDYFDKAVDPYDDPKYFDKLIMDLTTIGEITTAHKHRDFWNWMNRYRLSQ
ncbi:MAG: hypothetical protein K2X94_02905 [Amoebophilaceae bacterium]|nr:hypothetical protein [Amoebophilaceae bacterium]